MLIHLAEIKGYEAFGGTESVGTVYDFLFDDEHWVVRYVAVDTGGWLSGRQVLLAPASISRVDPDRGTVRFDLTRPQIESSPPLAVRNPISRQYEGDLAKHYGWPQYWGSRAMQTAAVGPPPVPPERAGVGKPETANHSGSNLRSVKEVTSYDLETPEGRAGRIEDFLADDYSWKIQYVVIDTGTWLTGRMVLMAPDWIDRIDWQDGRALTGLTKSQIRSSPEYDPRAPIARDYEERLHEHYGREKYWIADRNTEAVRFR